MLLTAGTRYAVRAMAYITTEGEGRWVPSHEFAGPKGFPRRFLLKILGRLVQGRLLRSVKGPHGGYRLARPARGITLLEVVEAVEGPIRGLAPFDGGWAPGDQLQALCDQVADRTRARLRKVKLSDLPGKGGRRHKP
jgi:Rrf2 family protein